MDDNIFSAMTKAEKSLYLGLANETLLEGHKITSLQGRTAPAESVDHVAGGLLTWVKQQGSCRSGWAFAATASFEAMHAAITWKLKTFADQEILDCTYEYYAGKDGCAVGWMYDGWNYLKKAGHFSLNKHVGYHGRDRPCDYSGIPSDMNNVKVTGYTRVTGDGDLMRSIWEGVPAVAITVEDSLYSYYRGIYTGCPSKRSINHAVAVVGYDPSAWKIRNSWGGKWGESGYFRMTRARPNMCRISDYVMYPNVERAPHGQLYKIRNTETGRLLSLKYSDSLEDIRDKRAAAQHTTVWMWATDRNYYHDALWRILDLGSDRVMLEHQHSGRYLSSDGDPIREEEAGGGWLRAPHVKATSRSVGMRAVWLNKNSDLVGGSVFLVNQHNGRMLFAAGSVVKGKPASGKYENVKVLATDSNYYGFARWTIERFDDPKLMMHLEL